MENKVIQEKYGGFWIRFLAAWIDLLIIYLVLTGIVELFKLFGIYLPFELSFILFVIAYSFFLIGLKGQTLGKMLCNLTVQSMNKKPVRYGKAFLREVIGKLLSGIFLLLGFLWVALSRKKRGWHDYLASTVVVHGSKVKGVARIVLIFVIFMSLVLLGRDGYEMISLYKSGVRMKIPPEVKTSYSNREPASLIEVSNLKENDIKKLENWLTQNGKDPVDYVVETASRHQVTIFGEVHGNGDYLSFLNRIIRDLYYRAGVSCIGMEVCSAENNEKINRLVTAKEYDKGLALEIARDSAWGIWGLKEYWDVFETVWRLNKDLPDGKKKMKVIGIDTKWDGASLVVALGAEGKKPGPVWEKLRTFRLFDDFIKLLFRDQLMARNVEKEIIEKGERGIIWIGSSHSYTHYRQPRLKMGKLVREEGRMGFILHERHGDKVFQVVLHNVETPVKEVYPDYKGEDPIFTEFIEGIMRKGRLKPVGFNVYDSPFAMLRDNNSFAYHFQPTVSFSDLARGYIYFKPFKELQNCQWMDGFISKKMFAENKTFYESWCNRKFKNVEEVNKFFSEFY
jgi:uncharacterized RDD family membrane protein YckC